MQFVPGMVVKLSADAFSDSLSYPVHADETCYGDYVRFESHQLNGQVAEIISSTFGKSVLIAYLPYLNKFINCFAHRFEPLPTRK